MADLLDGRYRLHEELGKGGFGTVFRAERLVLGKPLRQVAVKLFDTAAVTSIEEVLEEALRVISVTNGCQDPVIRDRFLFCYDAGIEPAPGGRPYLVTELMRGGLDAELRPHEGQAVSLPLARVRVYLRQICEAVAFMHGRGIVHRDLKPANVLVSPAGNVKVADFGLAAQVDSALPQASLGTLAYQPWEVIALHDWTKAADVYAIGLIAYEMLTGGLPNQDRLLAYARQTGGEADRAALLAVKRMPVRKPPSEANPEVRGTPLDDVVMRALSVHRTDRYANAGELLEALQDSGETLARPAPRASAETLIDQTDRAMVRGDRTLAAELRKMAEQALASLPVESVTDVDYPRLTENALRGRDRGEARRLAAEGLRRRPGPAAYRAAASAFAGTELGRAYADRASRARA